MTPRETYNHSQAILETKSFKEEFLARHIFDLADFLEYVDWVHNAWTEGADIGDEELLKASLELKAIIEEQCNETELRRHMFFISRVTYLNQLFYVTHKKQCPFVTFEEEHEIQMQKLEQQEVKSVIAEWEAILF